MIVVDVNIVAYFWLPGEWSFLAEKAMQQDPEWMAPYLWRSELRNVLAGYIRKKLITGAISKDIMSSAESFFSGNEFHVNSTEILELTESSSCSAYDCEYIALAKSMSVPLVTMDKKILHSFPTIAFSLEDFVK